MAGELKERARLEKVLRLGEAAERDEVKVRLERLLEGPGS